MKVLIIEPDPIARIITERLISFYYEPSVCSTEEEAIMLLREHFFGAILVASNHMEAQSKIHFLKKLKWHPFRRMKAFALCPVVNESTRTELITGGYTEVLRKPLRIQELVALL